MYPCFLKGQDLIKAEDYQVLFIDDCAKNYVPSAMQTEVLRNNKGCSSPPPFTNEDLGVSMAILSSELVIPEARPGTFSLFLRLFLVDPLALICVIKRMFLTS